MIIKKLSAVPFENTTGYQNVTKQIIIGPRDGSDEIVMRYFSLKEGGASPYHSHDFPHLVQIIQGNGIVIDAEKTEHPLKAGDYVFVKPGEIHGFKNTGQEPFDFICTIPIRGET
jgi:quercetin dioxygenase-like cupin family protein